MNSTARSRLIRDIIIYLIIFVCIFSLVGSQIYLALSRERSTVNAVMFTTRQSISFTGVIVRDEKFVHSDYFGDGVLNYCIPDGGRLSRQSQIARYYTSSDQIYYRYKISRLNDELNILTKAQDKGTTEYAQPEFISSQIAEEYKAILSAIAQGDLGQVYNDKLNMLKLMCIYNVSSNIESSFDQRISYLRNELDKYNSALVSPVSTINSVESGYFTSVVDGYESELSIEGIPALTVERINKIISKPQKDVSAASNVIGKVFSDYKWKLVGVIDTPDRYFVNESFDLLFSSLGRSYKGHVESITLTGNGNEAIIVIGCDEMDASIAAARILDTEILFGEYTGIKAPRSAIRFQGNNKGVYVLEGEKMLFKKLDVVYEGDDYVLSAYTAESGYLELYDRVLLDPVPTVNTEDNEDTDSDVGDDNDGDKTDV